VSCSLIFFREHYDRLRVGVNRFIKCEQHSAVICCCLLQLEEERLETIHRENHKLLERMAQIMSTKGNDYTYNDYECRRYTLASPLIRRVLSPNDYRPSTSYLVTYKLIARPAVTHCV